MKAPIFPNPHVVELWRRLSAPLEEVRSLERILQREKRIEVFDEFSGTIPLRKDPFGTLVCSETYFAPIDSERFAAFLSMNYRTKAESIRGYLCRGIMDFLKCAIENVFQHANGFDCYVNDIHTCNHRLTRTLDTHGRARAILVA